MVRFKPTTHQISSAIVLLVLASAVMVVRGQRNQAPPSIPPAAIAPAKPLKVARLPENLELGPFPQPTWQLIKADQWQSARSLGDWSLVHCTVSPGFCFDDFELIAGDGRTD